MKVFKTMHGEWRGEIDTPLDSTRVLRLSASRIFDKTVRVKFTSFIVDGNFEVFKPHSDYSELVAIERTKRVTDKYIAGLLEEYKHLVPLYIAAAKSHYNIAD